jgi:hypothetical protein
VVPATHLVNDRWSWVFWVLLVAAVAPLAAAVATVARVLDDEEFQGFLSYGAEPVFKDEWLFASSVTDLRTPVATTGVAVLALGALVLSRRPRWLLVPRDRTLVGSLSALSALATATTTALSVWAFASPSTERQVQDESQGVFGSTGWWDLVPGTATGLLFLTVEVLLAIALLRNPSDQRVGEDAVEGRPAE